MADIFVLVMPLFGLIFLGYTAARFIDQPIEALGWLNIFIVYLALPALFFKLLSRTPVEQLASLDFVVVNVAVTFLVFLLGLGLALISKGVGLAEATIRGLGGAYGNIGYMGPALAILALGETAAVPVALIFCFENIMHFTLAPALMAASGREQTSPARLAVLVIRRILCHPFIIATAAGVFAAVVQFPTPLAIERLIDYLAQAAAPCALFAMGVTLALRPLKRVPADIVPLVPIKLLIHPLLMYLALSFFGDFNPVWLMTAVLLASLPTATNVFVLAQQYGVWVERASACVLFTTLASVISVSLLLYLVAEGLLPPDLFP